MKKIRHTQTRMPKRISTTREVDKGNRQLNIAKKMKIRKLEERELDDDQLIG
jgi:hypothetical protein